MVDRFRFGVAILSIASGIITALSAVPLFYVSPGTIRDENFMPVSGQAILFFVLLFVVAGLVVVSFGVMLLAVPKWGIVWAVIVLAVSANNLRSSFLGSTGLLVIASVMGVSAGLLGILSKSLIMSRIMQNSFSWRNWLTAFPFALIAVGLWEFTGIFMGCGPPEGIGTSNCELPGTTFYAVSTVAIAAALSILAVPVLYALHRGGARWEGREAVPPRNSSPSATTSLPSSIVVPSCLSVSSPTAHGARRHVDARKVQTRNCWRMNLVYSCGGHSPDLVEHAPIVARKE